MRTRPVILPGVPRHNFPWRTLGLLVLALAANACSSGQDGPADASDAATMDEYAQLSRACPLVSEATNGAVRGSDSAPLADKLDTLLLRLVRHHQDESVTNTVASVADLQLDQGLVQVHVVAKADPNVEALHKWIVRSGGSVESVFENNLYGVVPLACVAPLAKQEAVWRIDLERNNFSPANAPVQSAVSVGSSLMPNLAGDRGR